ncbi:helix-turn-helix transcriptional regulator [Siccirubricoccus sp. KC 17139]|uniref:Helix-turn-helix transcriptional regulator n=1 Tax=Siccirubricoccus soli TaxID=2899147 RepID=A0ABT1D0W5_9PROT|nr:helix-turn-helix transcriptional regulator [Siccirubricoccus soli]MCO6414955.1 helix-turn-helix transcriptional regulator [Siccirubricoccus soli]MCP2681086.1 helix-turn-helix transcriptional regulator [Siccirubricoccus soli]
MPDVLTLREAAAFLRLSERSLYELARQRRLPAAQLGGKWLFPRRHLVAWLAAEAEAGAGFARPDPPPILAGSHDPLLDWAVRQSGCGLALRIGGSLDGLAALAAGEAMTAATHLLDPDTGTFNEPAVREALPGRGMVGIIWAWREQGLILPSGNPAGLHQVADLARPGLRVAGRQARAGSHVLLTHLLTEAGIRLDQIAFLPSPAMSEDEVAAAVAEGRAEVGFGIRAEAALRGLGFVPLVSERFDLVMPRRQYFMPAMQALLDFARGTEFTARGARLGGYALGETGKVAFNL